MQIIKGLGGSSEALFFLLEKGVMHRVGIVNKFPERCRKTAFF